jgi:hypothetical protein
VMWVLWNLVSVRLEMVLVSVQDSVTVCTKRTIGSEIVLDTPMVLLGYEAQHEAHFGPFGYRANLDDRCTVCSECTVGSKIVLDASDGTPM